MGSLAKVLSTVLIVLWASGAAHAQATAIEEAKQKLTGGSSRVWVHQKTVTMMGTSGERCTAGRLYRFAAGGSVLTIIECVDGKMVKSSHSWALSQTSPIDIILTIDGTKSYQLRFFDEGERHTLRLRDDVGPKTAPTTDLEFELGAD
jgi:hypothetical protein